MVLVGNEAQFTDGRLGPKKRRSSSPLAALRNRVRVIAIIREDGIMTRNVRTLIFGLFGLTLTLGLMGCQGFDVQASGNGSGAQVRVNAPGFGLRVDADQNRGIRVSANGRDFAFDLDGRSDGRVRARAQGRDFKIDARSDGRRTLVRGQANGKPIHIDVAAMRQENRDYPYAQEEAMANQALLQQINAHRRARKLSEVRLDAELCRQARLGSEQAAQCKELGNGICKGGDCDSQQQQGTDLRYAARFPYRGAEEVELPGLGRRKVEDPDQLAGAFADLYRQQSSTVWDDPALKSVGLATTIQGDGRLAYNDFRYRLES